MDADRCVSCGAVIPEGRQVCPKCEFEAAEKRITNAIRAGFVPCAMLYRDDKGETMPDRPCAYNRDEFCVNADCPYCADYCPVTESPDVCKYYKEAENDA